MRKKIWVPVICAVLLLFACVTINIYFPAEKVESVAGDIVKDVRGPAQGESEQDKRQDSMLRIIRSAMSPSLSWAQSETTVSNPTIRALKEGMRSRFARLKPYYAREFIREADSGFIVTQNLTGLGLKEQRDLKNLVDAENRDRQVLYTEVAKALKIDQSQVEKIARIFAKEWQRSIR